MSRFYDTLNRLQAEREESRTRRASMPTAEESIARREDEQRRSVRRLQYETLLGEQLKSAQEEQEAARNPLNIAAETGEHASGYIPSAARCVGEGVRGTSAQIGQAETSPEESQSAYERGLERAGGAKRIASIGPSPEDQAKIEEYVRGGADRVSLTEEASARERARIIREAAEA